MAWTIDTNFGNGLYTSDARAPFPTSGGNRVIGFGAGHVYRDDTDILDCEISCNVSAIAHGTHAGGSAIGVTHLTARRQPDGSFYTCSYVQADSMSLSRRAVLFLYRYDGTGDTFTFLAQQDIFITDPLEPNQGDLLKLFFRIQGSSLIVRLFNDSNQLISELGKVDTVIQNSGNPGIGARLIPTAVTQTSFMLGDNWKVNEI